MIKLDLWYGDTLEDVAAVDCFYSDLDGVYRGNIYDADGCTIGDYVTADGCEVEETFNYSFDRGGKDNE